MQHLALSWMAAGFETMRLMMAAQQVIGLRMMRLAGGGPRAEAEVERMVSDKAAGFTEAAMTVARAAASGAKAPVVFKAGVRKLKRRVNANKSRLSRR